MPDDAATADEIEAWRSGVPVPRARWDAARAAGWRGPLAGWPPAALLPPAIPHQRDQFAIEEAMRAWGWQVDGMTRVSLRGSRLDADGGRTTAVVLPIGSDGGFIDRRMPLGGGGPAHSVLIVRLHARPSDEPHRTEDWTASAHVYATKNRRLLHIGVTDSPLADETGWVGSPYDALYGALVSVSDEHRRVRSHVSPSADGPSAGSVADVPTAASDTTSNPPLVTSLPPERPLTEWTLEERLAYDEAQKDRLFDELEAEQGTEEDGFDQLLEEIDAAAAEPESVPSADDVVDAEDFEIIVANDSTPIAPTPDRVFDVGATDLEGGSVYLVGHEMTLITRRGWIRTMPVPEEFLMDGHVIVPALVEWLDASGGPVIEWSDLPTSVSAGEFLGVVGDGASRPTGYGVPDERRRRLVRRWKYGFGAVAVTAATAAGVSTCGSWGDQANDAALREMQDRAVLQELSAEEAEQAECDRLGGRFDVDLGACTLGGASGDSEGREQAPTEDLVEPAEPAEAPVSESDTADDELPSAAAETWRTGALFGAAAGSVAGVSGDDPLDGESFSILGTAGAYDASSAITGFDAALVSFTDEVASQLWGNTSYPCGADAGGVRVTCPAGAGMLGGGEYFVVSVQLGGPVAGGDATYTYGLAFDDDGDESDNFNFVPPYDGDFFRNTEHWYRLEISRDGERRMWADGYRNGIPAYPRASSALVIEDGDLLVWVVPRSEVPGPAPAFRATAFHDAGEVPFEPATSGGDVTGLSATEPLTAIPHESSVVVDDVGALPPDVEGTVDRVEIVDPPDVHIAKVLIEDFVDRADAAFASGDPASVDALLLTGLLEGPASAACRAAVDGTIGQAIGAALVDPGGPPVESGVVLYSPTLELEYPTGTVPWQAFLVVAPDGRLATVLPECVS